MTLTFRARIWHKGNSCSRQKSLLIYRTIYFTSLTVAVYSVLSLAMCYFFFCVFSPFSIAVTSLGEERANLCVFRAFVRFALVWFCLFPPPFDVCEGLRLVIVALPGHFSFFLYSLPSIQHYLDNSNGSKKNCWNFRTITERSYWLFFFFFFFFFFVNLALQPTTTR